MGLRCNKNPDVMADSSKAGAGSLLRALPCCNLTKRQHRLHPRPLPVKVRTMPEFLLTSLIFLAAALYASVGHAGASGYLAAMALAGVNPAVMKPTALVLNILVATLVTIRYARARLSSLTTLWPFAVGSVPFAFLGGAWPLPATFYRPMVGAMLLYGALRMARPTNSSADGPIAPPGRATALAVGSGIGLLSGLTGTGGGIFLSPLLILKHWTGIREASGTAAAFILVNSVAGLAGNFASVGRVPRSALPWAIAAGVGAILGTELGTRRLAPHVLRRLLAVVLAVAGAKMLLT